MTFYFRHSKIKVELNIHYPLLTISISIFISFEIMSRNLMQNADNQMDTKYISDFVTDGYTNGTYGCFMVLLAKLRTVCWSKILFMLLLGHRIQRYFNRYSFIHFVIFHFEFREESHYFFVCAFHLESPFSFRFYVPQVGIFFFFFFSLTHEKLL